MPAAASEAEHYEQQHVHAVYEEIASHFSATRFKPWPIIERFLLARPAGSVGVDVGCGNGKYLAVNPHVFIVGSDRSHNLTSIARQHLRHDAVVADALAVPHAPGSVDFAISIAVVHHLSTPARRVAAITQVLDVLNADGQALIYVWALEQKTSRRGWDEGDDQDVMVPWVMKAPRNRPEPGHGDGPPADRTFHRYYHLYRKGELEHDIVAAGGAVVDAGYEKDNWWAIASKRQDR